jgi:hypothetical protein
MTVQNPIAEAVSSILIVAATLVVAHHAEKALAVGIKKVRPALKIPKLSR